VADIWTRFHDKTEGRPEDRPSHSTNRVSD
jgi:hypothetical protein